jgi:hypothetical protein
MKNLLINLRKFALNCVNAGNFVLHLMLGTGIAMVFLKWERDFVGQIAICGLLPFGIVFIGEYAQKLIFKAKPNIYDAYNSGIAGLITVLIFLSIYGFKFGYEIQKQEPKMIWHYGGWVLIAVSTLIWIVKQLNKKFSNQ